MMSTQPFGPDLEDWLPEGTARIPMLGEVAAGQPLDVYSVEETLDVPQSLWKGRKVFALRVRGSSMIDEGIRDGDYLIVEPCESADDGRTVVAEVNGQVTVKKVYREGTQVRLQPANPEMLPLRVDAEDVRIVGVVAGVLRKFGFGERKPAAPKPAHRTPAPVDPDTLDLELNTIESQLTRWRTLLDSHSEIGQRDRIRMASMGRDLQALHDWYMRTARPGLRRALMEDAQKVILRMNRLLAARGMDLPDLHLH
jgi:hypothetical protein